MKRWFSSDWHLGHKNIVGPTISRWEDGYRDFSSLEQMDSTIINTMNHYIAQDDELYFHGDMGFLGGNKLQSYRDRIICKNIYFIKGNHDDDRVLKHVFPDWQHVIEKDFEGTKFFMSHYAHRVWNKSHRGSIHLYGHSHSNLDKEPWGKSMDVGVDNAYKIFGEWRPFSLEEVFKIMEKREIKYIDHHKERE